MIQLQPHSKDNATVSTNIKRIMLEIISAYFEHCMEHVWADRTFCLQFR